VLRKTAVALIPSLAAVLVMLGGPARGPRLRTASPSPGARTAPRVESLREMMRESARGEDRYHEGRGYRDAFRAWFVGQRAYPGETIPRNALGRAVAAAQLRNQEVATAGDSGDLGWRALGPSSIPHGQTDTTAGPALSPVSGRVSAIAVHPRNPNIAYVGGAQGGVWKTFNARSSKPVWTPLTDHEASLAVGSIAIDPIDPDIVYVGTGEPNNSCDSYYGRGILRSTDGGRHWKVLGGGGGPFNNAGPFVGKSVSKILVDPETAGSKHHATLWASTEFGAYTSGTAAACNTPTIGPFGVWRSQDSGETWEQQTIPSIGFNGFGDVSDMALDPVDHETLYVAQYGGGVLKSTNAATGAPAVFTPVVNGFPTGSIPTFLARITLGIGGPGAPKTLYAAVENGATSQLFGFFTTTDGGASWANVDAGFHGEAIVTNVDFGPLGVFAVVSRVSGPPFETDGSWSFRRLIFDNQVSSTIFFVNDPDTILLTGAYPLTPPPVSTWSMGNYPTYCDGQCFYDMTVGVDPTDDTARRVYVGGNPHAYSPNAAPDLREPVCDQSLDPHCPAHYNWRTDDAGLTWASISQGDGSGGLHTDDHAIAFDKHGAVFDGNDGGIWRSDDRGASWTAMNTNLAITQFQGVSTHPQNRRIVLGGTQDNGTNLLNSQVAPPPKWFHSDHGDGGQSLIDHGTPARMFHTYFNQSFNFMGPAKTQDGGTGGPATWDFVGSLYYPGYENGMDPTDPVSFYAPIAQHPAFAPNVVYFGSNRVYRATDPKLPCCDTVFGAGCGFPGPLVCTNAASWTAVSPALTKGGRAYLSWIGVFPKRIADKEVLYTGASDGRLAASNSVDGTGVAAWHVIDAPPLPNRAVTSVEVDGRDPTGNTVYVTFSGFNERTPTTPGHVFMTTNGLSPTPTWTNISGDLPDLPLNRIVLDGKAIFVATDIGVFRTKNGGAHWKQVRRGLPFVTVFGLERNPKTGQIVASTHGRGMFELVNDRNESPHDDDDN
jgi:photosystem II stability/assembly factor-like uncharacterized protein